MAQTKLRAVKCVQWMFVFKATAYTLIWLPRCWRWDAFDRDRPKAASTALKHPEGA